jgi:dihydrofolate synthase/folylpolyglutamate synthase
LINYEQRTPNIRDLKLDRMARLLDTLGNPHKRLRIVHVSGSKGKGSTSAMLAAVLQRSGYRTGLFTSPHLCAVEERFLVNDRPISEAELTALLNEVRAAAGRVPDLTFFEVASAVGFLHFVRNRVDVAVFEVGLGGRFDSTNVCMPMVSVITSISFDHTRQLGNRLSSIAREKAGIIKPGRPVLSGATAPEARQVIQETARMRRSKLKQIGEDFHYTYEPASVGPGGVLPSRVEVRTRRRTWPTLHLNLHGEHQAANAALVIACVEELRHLGLSVTDQAVTEGLAEVHWPARMELLHCQPYVVLDCAHNTASAEAVIETLQHTYPPARRHLIFAASNDKDLPGMCKILAPHFENVIVTRFQSNPRCADPEEVAGLFEANGARATVVEPTQRAWEVVSTLTQPDDLICITGSVFLAGELRPVVLGHSW